MRFSQHRILSLGALVLVLHLLPSLAFSDDGKTRGGGGGNSQAGKMFAQYIESLEKLEGGDEIKTILRRLAERSPGLGRELDAAVARLKIYLIPKITEKFGKDVTGLPVPSEQDALHNTTHEVFAERRAFESKAKEAKIHFLALEIFEELLLQKYPKMNRPKLHASARAMADFVVPKRGDVDAEKLQQELILRNVGYYTTRAQDEAVRAAAKSAPVQAANVIVLKNDVPIDLKNPPVFKPGNRIRIIANGKNPGGGPLQYRFSMHRDKGRETMQDWSDKNNFEYIVRKNDPLLTQVTVVPQVRNQSGVIDAEERFITLKVQDKVVRVPALIQEMRVYTNGQLVRKKNVDDHPSYLYEELIHVKVGDEVRIEVDGKDPKGLPIEYSFVGCGDDWGKRTWTKSKVWAYKVQAKDRFQECGFSAIARNNTGVQAYQYQYNFNVMVEDPAKALGKHPREFLPRIKNVRMYINGVLAERNGIFPQPPLPREGSLEVMAEAFRKHGFEFNGRGWNGDSFGNVMAHKQYVAPGSVQLKAGDRIRFEIEALDPLGKPVEFRVRALGDGFNQPVIVDWTKQTSLEFVLKAEHLYSRSPSGFLGIDLRTPFTEKVKSWHFENTHNMPRGEYLGPQPTVAFSAHTDRDKKIRPLRKTEASELADFLRARDKVACASILGNLEDLAKDPEREHLEVLAFVNGQVDQKTLRCLGLVEAGLKGILRTPVSMQKHSPGLDSSALAPKSGEKAK